jgi:thioester reductase-like protein
MTTNTQTTMLMTGATGFIGRELLAQLLAAHRDLDIVALVRARDDVALATRREALVRGLPPRHAARVDVVRGDMTQPRFGLERPAYLRLLDRVGRVEHCAASTRFDSTLEQARLENVVSTKHVLSFCRGVRDRGRSGRLDHVSTAFVAGRRRGLVREDELVAGQTFRNTYEQTKVEAELACRAAMDELPIVIHRPSIVVGKRSSGETSSYKAAYGPMRLLVESYDRCPQILNRIVPLPLPPDVLVDLVPVDYVAAGITALYANDAAVGRCFHLTAGAEGAASIRELVHLACDHFGTPRLRFLRPGLGLRLAGRLAAPALRSVAPKAMNVVSIMYAYGLGMPTFDTSNAQAVGLSAPPVLQYFEAILRYAFRTGFGRSAAGVRSERPAYGESIAR